MTFEHAWIQFVAETVKTILILKFLFFLIGS